jgi:hypothetical protein
VTGWLQNHVLLWQWTGGSVLRPARQQPLQTTPLIGPKIDHIARHGRSLTAAPKRSKLRPRGLSCLSEHDPPVPEPLHDIISAMCSNYHCPFCYNNAWGSHYWYVRRTRLVAWLVSRSSSVGLSAWIMNLVVYSLKQRLYNANMIYWMLDLHDEARCKYISTAMT